MIKTIKIESLIKKMYAWSEDKREGKKTDLSPENMYKCCIFDKLCSPNIPSVGI